MKEPKGISVSSIYEKVAINPRRHDDSALRPIARPRVKAYMSIPTKPPTYKYAHIIEEGIDRPTKSYKEYLKIYNMGKSKRRRR